MPQGGPLIGPKRIRRRIPRRPIRGGQVVPFTSATPPTNATSARPAGTK